MLPWQNLCCPSHVSSTAADQFAVFFFYVRHLRCCWTVSICTDVQGATVQKAGGDEGCALQAKGIPLVSFWFRLCCFNMPWAALRCRRKNAVQEARSVTVCRSKHDSSLRIVEVNIIFPSLMKVPQAWEATQKHLIFPLVFARLKLKPNCSCLGIIHTCCAAWGASKWFRPASDCDVEIFGFCHWFWEVLVQGYSRKKNDTTWYNMIHPQGCNNSGFSTLLRLPWVLFRRTRRRCAEEHHATLTPKGETWGDNGCFM